ncbi:LysM domain-containing protein [Mesobacillus persicus]|uniref:LysM domain-containing protein n=1 Tax=Mesobacillus persicus TaxID=930146 RepID=A0A1H8BSZ4_9BACI|nr:LysM peptidoglycan-binding domain-containing protein [Mesobacillus persicus]SEM86021.1 LysM domain-containing protein [Mesobacillus persicus]
MNKETPYRNQVEQTRKKIVREKSTSHEKAELPPRSRLHGQSQKKRNNKWKLKYPVIRLLVLFFILLPISIFSAYSYLNNETGEKDSRAVQSGGYEKINLEKNKPLVEESTRPVMIEEKSFKEEKADAAVLPTPLESKSMLSQGDTKNSPPPEMGSVKENRESPPASDDGDPQVLEQPHENQEQPENPAEENIVFHTVGQGENLFRISLKYYNSQNGMEIIRKANNLQGDEIKLGQVLKIPLGN